MTTKSLLEQIESSDFYKETKLRLDLSEAVAKAMREEKLSPRELAEKSGVSYQQILRVLDDDHNSTLGTITKLADALSREALLIFEDPEAVHQLKPTKENFASLSDGNAGSVNRAGEAASSVLRKVVEWQPSERGTLENA